VAGDHEHRERGRVRLDGRLLPGPPVRRGADGDGDGDGGTKHDSSGNGGTEHDGCGHGHGDGGAEHDGDGDRGAGHDRERGAALVACGACGTQAGGDRERGAQGPPPAVGLGGLT
jgi:hypothetical protein